MIVTPLLSLSLNTAGSSAIMSTAGIETVIPDPAGIGNEPIE